MSNKEEIDKTLNELIQSYKSIPEGHYPQEFMDSLSNNLDKLKDSVEKIDYDEA